MKENLKWTLIIVVAVPPTSALAIALVETRPSHEWAGIAQFLLCVVVPLIGALIVGLTVYIEYLKRKLNKLRGGDQ